MAREESLTNWGSVSTDWAERPGSNRAWSINWWLIGPPITFVLSALIFDQSPTVPPITRPASTETAVVGQLDQGSSGPAVDTSVWQSGMHVSDAAIHDYSWAASPRVESLPGATGASAGTAAQLKLSCGSDWAFASIEFSETPNIVSATSIGGGYQRVSAVVAWDGETETVEFLQESGSRTLSFADEQAAISALAGATSMQLTLAWQGQEPRRFEFPLDGASATIADMGSRCR